VTHTRFERYVAIGDSSTEGLNDPDGQGGFRGWANRLAEHIAREQGSLLYANLAIRGRRVGEILDEQLEPALAMRPDIATLFAGTNDVVANDFDPGSVRRDLEQMQGRLVESGATVLGFTLPDLAPVMPVGRLVSERVATLNEIFRTTSEATGAILVDFAAYPMASDRRIWHEDRLHANEIGHERIAAALADALDLPGSDATWKDPLPVEPAAGPLDRLSQEASWIARYFIPWVWRHLWGRSSGDGRLPKRPQLEPVEFSD
jgi:lysophospholipase L1-like esterase